MTSHSVIHLLNYFIEVYCVSYEGDRETNETKYCTEGNNSDSGISDTYLVA